MLAIFAGLLAGLAVVETLGALGFFAFVPMVVVGVALCSYERDAKNSWKVLAVMAVVSMICSLRIYAEFSRPDAKPVTLHDSEGVISYVRTWGKNYAAILSCETGDYVFILPPKNFKLYEGTRLKFTGVTNYFREKSGKSDFDEKKFWRARGVDARITLLDYEILPEKFSFYKLRDSLSHFLRKNLPHLTSDYLRAAWLGDRVRDLNEKHQRWGTSHLLAVSGFHVGIVILCARKFFRNKFAISALLWAYVFLTGASASAMRAALMLQVAILSKILWRPVNSVNSVSVAGVILLLKSPFYFWDIGWRLSIISALTISALLKNKSARKYLFLILNPLIVLTTFAQVTHVFGQIPLVGLFLNLFAPAFFAIAFSVASFGAMLYFLEIPFTGWLMLIINGGFMAWEKFADFAAGIMNFKLHENFLLSWLGAGVLFFVICKSFGFSQLRSFVITLALTCMSFVIFGGVVL